MTGCILVQKKISGFVFYSADQFYLDALKRIDGDIARQIQDIESKVMWKQKFKVNCTCSRVK